MHRDYVSCAQGPCYPGSGIVGAITLVGIFFLPAIAFSCLMVLTGDDFYDKTDRHGHLQRWTRGNKLAAVIILIIQVGFTVAMVSGAFAG